MEKFIEELKKGRGMDCIAEHYYSMSKEELKEIALELLWQLHRVTTQSQMEEIAKEISITLEDYIY